MEERKVWTVYLKKYKADESIGPTITAFIVSFIKS